LKITSRNVVGGHAVLVVDKRNVYGIFLENLMVINQLERTDLGGGNTKYIWNK
jgi:hypothetical protein